MCLLFNESKGISSRASSRSLTVKAERIGSTSSLIFQFIQSTATKQSPSPSVNINLKRATSHLTTQNELRSLNKPNVETLYNSNSSSDSSSSSSTATTPSSSNTHLNNSPKAYSCTTCLFNLNEGIEINFEKVREQSLLHNKKKHVTTGRHQRSKSTSNNQAETLLVHAQSCPTQLLNNQCSKVKKLAMEYMNKETRASLSANEALDEAYNCTNQHSSNEAFTTHNRSARNSLCFINGIKEEAVNAAPSDTFVPIGIVKRQVESINFKSRPCSPESNESTEHAETTDNNNRQSLSKLIFIFVFLEKIKYLHSLDFRRSRQQIRD